MVRTVDIASRNRRPPNVDWRIGHTYSFLGAMEALGAGDTRAALAEALIRGQRGEIEPSLARAGTTDMGSSADPRVVCMHYASGDCTGGECRVACPTRRAHQAADRSLVLSTRRRRVAASTAAVI